MPPHGYRRRDIEDDRGHAMPCRRLRSSGARPIGVHSEADTGGGSGAAEHKQRQQNDRQDRLDAVGGPPQRVAVKRGWHQAKGKVLRLPVALTEESTEMLVSAPPETFQHRSAESR
jgi:hypothetical protein